MVKRRDAGYSLLEIVVSMAVFGIFLLILTILTAEMRNYEKKLPVNFMKHPQVTAVVSRLRQDVLDAPLTNDMYPSKWPPTNPEYEQSKQILIIRTEREETGQRVVVWDFREKGIAIRRVYNVGVATDWTARGLPVEMWVEANQISDRPWGLRLKATDAKGRLAIDQIFQPRAHE